jgi:hypothetical protein
LTYRRPSRTSSASRRWPLQIKFVSHNSGALFRNEPIHFGLTSLGWNLKDSSPAGGENLHGASFRVMRWGQWDWPLTLSTPERAILEMLDGLPTHESFDRADKIMEGLTTLSPRRLQKLLLDCKSIKVKREVGPYVIIRHRTVNSVRVSFANTSAPGR